MRIAYVGDSYCAGSLPHSWTEILADKLGAEIVCRGTGGISVVQSYFDLAAHVDKADIILMCYTDHNRLYNPHRYPIMSGLVQQYTEYGMDRVKGINMKEWPRKAIWDAAVSYYKHLYDERYHLLLHDMILDRCDDLLQLHMRSNPSKKVLHFYSFRPEGQKKSFVSGPCCIESLQDMVRRHGRNTGASDGDQNHMSPGLNKALANAVYDILLDNRNQWFGLP